MKPSEIIQRIVRHNQTNAVKMAAFRPGQIVSGKIVKLFPNQTAEVQIGSHKAVALLETPLSASSRYWFKVEPGDGLLRLKVIESANRSGTASPAESLLGQLGMQVSKENKMVLQFFLKEQLPITRETLLVASEWIKESQSADDGLRTVKELIIRQLPFSKEVFSALFSVMHGDSLSSLLEKLQQELKGIDLSSKGQQIYSLLGDLTKTAREKLGEQAIRGLISEWLNTKNQTSSQTAFQVLKAIGLIQGEAGENIALKQLIEGGSQNKSISSVLTELLKSNESRNRHEFISNLARLNELTAQRAESSGQAQTLETLLNGFRNGKISFPAEKNILNSLVKSALYLTHKDDLSHLLSGAYELKQAAVQAGKILAGENPALATALNLREMTKLEELKKSLRSKLSFTYDQRNILSELKSIIRTLGFSFENDLHNLLKQQDYVAAGKLDTLKPLLIGFLNEETSLSAKDAAERLLHKITGFQALSQEAGPLQHYIFQLPVSLWGKISDLTMQWSGRKTEGGKIDSSHCRVIFYLNLEHLNETIVDLQVQNRIINISVINEHKGIKDISAPFTAELKENLFKLNYKLSSVSFQKPHPAGDSLMERETMTSIVQSNQFTGVDIRI
ncbi:hypothetical protein AF332_21440 [Sporosarcina globispora]|uniref:Uncharacterized protein n=1 Tax=Sporosarcina globispora TaxID=1459 RepID=A0A0M0GI37_SPOGL|nr:hypothetical protein [Sporosarcina globispora]KON89106.1 hypothetical protein AF332_21440 [Sporosarcina globispora]